MSPEESWPCLDTNSTAACLKQAYLLTKYGPMQQYTFDQLVSQAKHLEVRPEGCVLPVPDFVRACVRYLKNQDHTVVELSDAFDLAIGSISKISNNGYEDDLSLDPIRLLMGPTIDPSKVCYLFPPILPEAYVQGPGTIIVRFSKCIPIVMKCLLSRPCCSLTALFCFRCSYCTHHLLFLDYWNGLETVLGTNIKV